MLPKKSHSVNIWDVYNNKLIKFSKINDNYHILKNISPVKGRYPNCGDEMSIYLELDDDTIKDISFKGELCMISTASANYMIDILKGKKIKQVRELIDEFNYFINHNEIKKEHLGIFENIDIFEKVNKLHGRNNCALLPWNTVKFILDKNKGSLV